MATLMQVQSGRKSIPATVLLAFVLTSFAGSGPVLAADFATDPMPVLELDTFAAGQSAEHRLRFSMFAGDLETYRAVVEYPNGFRFTGFHRPGPANSLVGKIELDLNADGVADTQVDLRSVTSHLAYADVIADGVFSAELEPRITVDPPALLVVHLPMGGDARADTMHVAVSVDATIVLSPGLINNPSSEGDYTVFARFSSVDPDTGGADDGIAPDPQHMQAGIALEILPAGPLAFQQMQVRRALLRSGRPGRDSFHITGHYLPDAGGDGVDPKSEGVLVVFGPFSQFVDASQFRRVGEGVVYSGRSGLRLLEISDDGSFVITTRSLDLGNLDRSKPVNFELRIGDDSGALAIPFTRSGMYPP